MPHTTEQRHPRILFIADKFGYPGGVLHGATTYFLDVLPALAEAGVAVTPVFVREHHPAVAALHAKGIVPTFLSAQGPSLAAFRSVLRLIGEHRCEIVHAAGYASTLIARAASRLVRSRTIVHVHELGMPGAGVRALERLLARPSDAGIGVSAAAGNVVVEGYHVPRERVRVIHNGIRLERFRNVSESERERVRAETRVEAGARVIGMIARMHPAKGHRAMLHMMPRVRRDCPEAVLLVVGDGPERGPCERLARELGLESHVRFLGQRDDIAEILSACDVVAVPSESEGLSMTAIEALAAGKPVAAYEVGGLGEVVADGISGRLVPPADTEAFSAALVSLLHETEAYPAYQARARHAAERFSIGAHIDKLLRCYHEVAEERLG